MHLFLSAGEPSGDLHGESLIHALKHRDPAARLVGFGGDRMVTAGLDLHFPLTQLAVMWFGRAMANLPTFFTVARRAEVYLRSKRPDALVLIDYPGFNFALAKRAHRVGVPVFYFVPPQLWAWAGWRVEKMRKWVDTVLTALPFEESWYRDRGVHTHYIGHPYFDELAEQRPDPEFIARQKAGGGPVVAILPGSRNQEVTSNLGLMLEAAGQIRDAVPGVRFLVASFNDRQAATARAELAGSGLPAEVHVGRTPEIIELADACVAVSGSVGLELMYRLKPTAVVYKVVPIGKRLARAFMTCRYISLVNLLADEEVFPEFLTAGGVAGEVAGHVVRWLRDPAARDAAVGKLRVVRDRVAIPGASDRAADYITSRVTARRATRTAG